MLVVVAVTVLGATPAHAGVILTFTGLTNDANLPGGYGSHVTSGTAGDYNASYGTTDGSYTPNVVP